MKSSLNTLITVFLLFIVAVNVASSNYFREWNVNWKSTYSKTYDTDTPAEEYEREMIWTANKKYALEHNSKINVGFMLEMNAIADMTEEYEEYEYDFHMTEEYEYQYEEYEYRYEEYEYRYEEYEYRYDMIEEYE